MFAALHREFAFTVDAAASSTNALLPRFWTEHDNALIQPWAGERVFCNPPFGRSIALWLLRAIGEISRGCPLAVLLVPARTDAGWWHDTVIPNAEIRFLRGRLQYTHPSDPERRIRRQAPFASAVLVFRSGT